MRTYPIFWLDDFRTMLCRRTDRLTRDTFAGKFALDRLLELAASLESSHPKSANLIIERWHFIETGDTIGCRLLLRHIANDLKYVPSNSKLFFEI